MLISKEDIFVAEDHQQLNSDNPTWERRGEDYVALDVGVNDHTIDLAH